MPKVSLIISTYNWPEALSLSLQSIMRQSRMPDEIIVADDGSRDETRELIERFAASSPVPLRHVWHEDKGFRKAIIFNRSVAVATGDYIIEIDGDIVVGENFVKDHLRVAEPGTFVCGSRVIIGEELSKKVLSRPLNIPSMWARGLHNRLNAMRSGLLSWLMSHKPAKVCRGCNVAYWRSDFIAVNGYNEDMKGWGSEDAELYIRLCNSGLRPRALKHRALAYHIYHREASRENVDANYALQQRACEEALVRCENGIAKYL